MNAYNKALAGEWVSAADISKLVRAAVKKAFPNHKFSVRISGSGGVIYVSWVDGPTAQEVDKVISPYETRGFDGSIDMGCSYQLWLYPDGSASVAFGSGTAGSMGFLPEVIGSANKPGAVLAERISSVFVHTSRDVSNERLLEAAEQIRHQNWTLSPWSVEVVDGRFKVNGDQHVGGRHGWLSSWIRNVAHEIAH